MSARAYWMTVRYYQHAAGSDFARFVLCLKWHIAANGWDDDMEAQS